MGHAATYTVSSVNTSSRHHHILTNVVKELSPRNVLHNHEDVRGRGDDLVQLDDVGVAEHLQDLNLTTDLLGHIEAACMCACVRLRKIGQ